MHIAAVIGISSYDSLKNFRYFKIAFLKNTLRNFLSSYVIKNIFSTSIAEVLQRTPWALINCVETNATLNIK